ncbi:RNA polymerase sigma factor SigM [Allostreptomyces psammosilenae]|uniref:RNA polymerase sigma-70 factor (ECF subfamily) n=1 Tax=Allostreptomyces psammosilenae TaxID=1892865 RepID=A0A853A4J4_9ACTN|nr:RNA polymerase sigma factor SigM [Allostreptomyces psammosilenae]NYI05418.1 RNA polymerase sigma-70 factor (ECF subfamily) [Allostreptomyces psammosilenae]
MAGEEDGRPGAASPSGAADLSRLDDAELLDRFAGSQGRAGEPAAFGELVRRHRERLWAVALRTTGHPEEASDALQDALLSAFRAAHRFRGGAAVTTWLHRIVVNACLDRMRRNAVRRAVPLPDEVESWDGVLGSSEPPDAVVERDERKRALFAALAQLPEEQRAALALVDMDGYSVVEAAEILGVPTGTVKSRCARGRARLLPLVRHLRQPAPSDDGKGDEGAGKGTGGGGNPGRPSGVTSTAHTGAGRIADSGGGTAP